ncbi:MULTISPECIES: hypothetical protein [Streptomyces]|uniref:Uncharacterized protein n=1 Tax=Streptomyces glycanivorans TaxID=3033808 RepID=A0ABY9JLP4_9ACTN|nr:MULTISPECIES: hypothetical protein [unclassified Streptomyces]WLQ68645.1 hypothetical protein P8A20_36115 [Streptomyces sp. Alt3]WSR52721.1 hypothetical protein OG279_36115 [Streptomyces sp. NBC_01201]
MENGARGGRPFGFGEGVVETGFAYATAEFAPERLPLCRLRVTGGLHEGRDRRIVARLVTGHSSVDGSTAVTPSDTRRTRHHRQALQRPR